MEVIKWTPAHKLENGELALTLSTFSKAANEAASLLDNLHLKESEVWSRAVGWEGSNSTMEALSRQTGVPVMDMIHRPRCFNEDYQAGYFAWEQTNQTGSFDATKSLFNKYYGNRCFGTGVYDSRSDSHWRPWEYTHGKELYEVSGYIFDRPHQYKRVEIKAGAFSEESFRLNSNQLPPDWNRENTYWRPIL
jgi:hypothetical protein